METERLLKQTEISVEAADHLQKRYIHVTHKDKQIADSAKEDTIVDMELLKELRIMSKEEEAKEWENCCIYRVPSYVRERNPQAYTPKIVSFGPYHHGAPHLMEMELHKHRALAHVLRRSGKSFEDYIQVLEPLTKVLMESYGNLDEKWKDPHKFLQLMVLDGFFWLEMTGVYVNKDKKVKSDYKFESDYCENDPMFSSSAAPFAASDLVDDMLMLENQLPGSLVRTLPLALDQMMRSGEVQEKQVPGSPTRTNSLASKQTTQPTEEQEEEEGIDQGKCKEPLHFLDEVRNIIVGTYPQSTRQLYDVFYTASDLHNVGVVFKKKDTENHMDFSFDKVKGILSLPVIHDRMATECGMLNMVAFEHLHPGKGHEISAYIMFIAFLLQTPGDVRLLQSEGLVYSGDTTAEKIAEYFQKLRHDMRFIPETSYEELRVDMGEYHKKNMKKWNRRLREWKLNLKMTYFKNPWSSISLVAAILLLALTALGTIYSVLAFYRS